LISLTCARLIVASRALTEKKSVLKQRWKHLSAHPVLTEGLGRMMIVDAQKK
jgi:hypothetical protein